MGAKIDVSATEQKTANTDIPAAWFDDSRLVNISPKATQDYSQEKYQTIQTDPDEAAAIVPELDDIYPLATTYEALQSRIFDTVLASTPETPASCKSPFQRQQNQLGAILGAKFYRTIKNPFNFNKFTIARSSSKGRYRFRNSCAFASRFLILTLITIILTTCFERFPHE